MTKTACCFLTLLLGITAGYSWAWWHYKGELQRAAIVWVMEYPTTIMVAPHGDLVMYGPDDIRLERG